MNSTATRKATATDYHAVMPETLEQAEARLKAQRPAPAPHRAARTTLATGLALVFLMACALWAGLYQLGLAQDRADAQDRACTQMVTAADAISKDSRVNWAELQVVVDAAQGYGSMADAEAPLAAREARLAKAQADYAQAKAVCTR